MIKIAKVLMDYGMDFQYENRGSEGEEITCYELSIEVKSYDGNVHLIFEGEDDTASDNDIGYSYIAQRVEEECINETSSF